MSSVYTRLSSHRRVSAASSTHPTVVRTGRTQLAYAVLVNTTAAAKYVRLYDQTTAPVNADIPVVTIVVPAGQTVQLIPPIPLDFNTGFAYRMTGAAPDTDATALAANDLAVTFWFR